MTPIFEHTHPDQEYLLKGDLYYPRCSKCGEPGWHDMFKRIKNTSYDRKRGFLSWNGTVVTDRYYCDRCVPAWRLFLARTDRDSWFVYGVLGISLALGLYSLISAFGQLRR